jgi:hypothetical protein
MQDEVSPMQDEELPLYRNISTEKEPIFVGIFNELSPNIIEKLDAIRSSKRSNSKDMRLAIKALCSVRSLTSRQLGSILHRGTPMLVQQYLTPMVADGSLKHLIPGKIFDNRQAYIAPPGDKT